MELTSPRFKANVRDALKKPNLKTAMGRLIGTMGPRRLAARAGLPEFERLCDQARDIKNHTLANLDFYLEAYEAKLRAAGGTLHWCRTPDEARAAILDLCRQAVAKTVTKGKSMIAEEIGLNEFLEANGIEPVETDLGEYIIQIAGEAPSHIIAPAVHKTKEEIADLFFEKHQRYGLPKRSEPKDLVDDARKILRPRYVAADVGITGANFLIAETGSSVIVTNEGNGDLTQSLPRMHIVVASLEKLVPTLEDVTTILRVLARSATGQEFSTYTTFSTGPRRADDLDGPAAYHVILLDNGRSRLLGTEFQDMLRCIRCGACMNNCPVYAAIGGHAYGSTYVGPMGAVLTPSLVGLADAHHLPNASSFCGRCEEVCPMRIPLPKMMRAYRERSFAAKLGPAPERWALAVWAFAAKRPKLYRRVSEAAARFLGNHGARRGAFRRLALAGGWTDGRDLPAPEGRTFHSLWRERQRSLRERQRTGAV
jgi:L-lactate dehydrogenase complex protein LldF